MGRRGARLTLNIAKVKKVAVIGDTTGYGVTRRQCLGRQFQKEGAEVVYKANIDATQPDMTPDMLRARNAGAEAIVIWSVSTGMIARLLNTRAKMGWDVPFIGHPALSSGEIASLLDKPDNWKKVYCIGYRSCSYDASGKLPPHTEELVQKMCRQGGPERHADVVGRLRRRRGGDDRRGGRRHRQHLERGDHRPLEHAEGAARLLRQFQLHAGGPQRLPGRRVMSDASSGKNGTFALAPGYG